MPLHDVKCRAYEGSSDSLLMSVESVRRIVYLHKKLLLFAIIVDPFEMFQLYVGLQ